MSEDMRNPVRVGLRVSAETNDWLDQKAKEMGIPKTALMNFAIETYKSQNNVVSSMPSMLKHLENESN